MNFKIVTWRIETIVHKWKRCMFSKQLSCSKNILTFRQISPFYLLYFPIMDVNYAISRELHIFVCLHFWHLERRFYHLINTVLMYFGGTIRSSYTQFLKIITPASFFYYFLFIALSSFWKLLQIFSNYLRLATYQSIY